MGILDRLFGGGETAAPTPSKQGGSYAGAKMSSASARVDGSLLESERFDPSMGKPGKWSKAIDYGAKGLTVLDAGFNVASLLNSNQKGKEAAREMAANLVDAGYTDYDQVMALAQGNSQMESAIGNIGVGDYAKTVAGITLQGGDLITAGPLGVATGILGGLAQIDLQRKKAGRNEAFREQFAQELINRGIK